MKWLFWSSAGCAFAASYNLSSAGSAITHQTAGTEYITGSVIRQGNTMQALSWMNWLLTFGAAWGSGSILKTFKAKAKAMRKEARRTGREPPNMPGAMPDGFPEP